MDPNGVRWVSVDLRMTQFVKCGTNASVFYRILTMLIMKGSCRKRVGGWEVGSSLYAIVVTSYTCVGFVQSGERGT